MTDERNEDAGRPIFVVDELVEYPLGAIDPAARRHGRVWCHLLTDGTEADLLAFGRRLFARWPGAERRWLQHKGQVTVHYDLNPPFRELALRQGAIEAAPGQYRAILRVKYRRSAEQRAQKEVAGGS